MVLVFGVGTGIYRSFFCFAELRPWGPWSGLSWPGFPCYLDNINPRPGYLDLAIEDLAKHHFLLGGFTSPALILLEVVIKAIKNILLLHQNQKLLCCGQWWRRQGKAVVFIVHLLLIRRLCLNVEEAHFGAAAKNCCLQVEHEAE